MTPEQERHLREAVARLAAAVERLDRRLTAHLDRVAPAMEGEDR